jgi:hypothetical protein
MNGRTGQSTGRAQRVLAHIDANPAGLTMRQLIEQVEPDCPLKRMSVTLSELMRTGRVLRTGNAPRSVYVRQHLPAPPPKAARIKPAPTPRRAPAPKPAPARPAAPAAPRVQPSASAPRPAPRSPALSALFKQVADRDVDRQTLAEDVARFEREGGRIERLPWGAASHSELRGHREINQIAWHDRQVAEA